jgi:hypothetical protein
VPKDSFNNLPSAACQGKFVSFTAESFNHEDAKLRRFFIITDYAVYTDSISRKKAQKVTTGYTLLRYRYAGHVAGQVNTDLALTLFKPADFKTNKTDHGYANKMNEKPSAVKKLKRLGQGH